MYKKSFPSHADLRF